MYDLELIERLYQKYVYQDKQGIKSDRKRIIEDYFQEKGVKIPQGTLTNYINKLNKQELLETKEVNKDYSTESTHISERYIEIPTSESWNDEDIVKAHGLDVNKWEIDRLGSTRSKIGTNGNEEGYLINTYQKATFKLRQFRLSQELIESLIKNLTCARKPITIETTVSNPNGLFLIPLKDMHFGHNSYDKYKPHQAELYKLIDSQEFEKIVFIIGSDLFHTNDSKGRTANDTQVDWNVEIEQRTEWAKKFYEPLFEIAQEKALEVEVYFEEGNHDKDQALLFVLAMKWLYPNIHFVIKEKEIYKAILFHDVFIGTHHGDMKHKPKDVAETFNNYFRLDIAKAKYREILIGHKHHTWSEEHLKILVQGLSTASKDTDFEYKHGFAGGDKSFQVRIYSRSRLKAMYIIDGENHE